MAAVGALSLSSSSSFFLANPSSRLSSLRRIPFVQTSCSSSSSSSSSSTEFKITFAPSPPKTLVPDPSPRDTSGPPIPFLIPWIVRDENGGLKLQATPPVGFLQATTKNDKSRKNKISSLPTSAPKHSKAARRFYNQNIREPQRLSKVLAAAGVASRRSSEDLIFGGKVTVNGSVCTAPQTRVDLSKDSIYVNGNRLSKKFPPKLYFAVNKPKGYICSNGDEEKSVVSLFDDYWKSWNKLNPGIPKPRLFTVGRLDVATTGLIIVTNDGDFAQQLSHPSSKFLKEYIASIEGVVHRKHLVSMSEGTAVDGVHCIPDSVELLPSQPDVTRPRLRIVVHEGRNHEVRELIRNSGLQLHSLKRVRIGGFRLPSDLGLGKYMELKEQDLKQFGGKIQLSRT
ncbi:23S rRNA pseudouridine2604 synthase [Apostasia shenzhenica]|uniref:23S rRNA pseudouridine2604 synthase n=1 Tax=Apostasia shenzhenica TaxID=1088818 RepID=A0A2H9ZXL3_9ASPA|nr:23S rRNA pseudouridine2604 synthase [Apostasia shenzhenica]